MKACKLTSIIQFYFANNNGKTMKFLERKMKYFFLQVNLYFDLALYCLLLHTLCLNFVSFRSNDFLCLLKKINIAFNLDYNKYIFIEYCLYMNSCRLWKWWRLEQDLLVIQRTHFTRVILMHLSKTNQTTPLKMKWLKKVKSIRFCCILFFSFLLFLLYYFLQCRKEYKFLSFVCI